MLQAHSVPTDIQVAIGLSPCNTVGMFCEYFGSKDTVKSECAAPSDLGPGNHKNLGSATGSRYGWS